MRTIDIFETTNSWTQLPFATPAVTLDPVFPTPTSADVKLPIALLVCSRFASVMRVPFCYGEFLCIPPFYREIYVSIGRYSD